MGSGSRVASSLFIFLFLLFLAVVGEALGEIEMQDSMEATSKEKKNHPMIIKMVTKMGHENSQEKHSNNVHMEQKDLTSIVFFTRNDLEKGKNRPIFFPKRDDPSKSPPSLPKERADRIPFSLKQLPQILSFFNFPSGSPQGQAVKRALRECEQEPAKGETRLCATSMEAMVNYVATSLGPKSSFTYLKTSHLTKSEVHFQNYTIFEAPEEIAAPRLVACHSLRYPYAVYYCHYQQGENIVVKVPLKGDNGDRVDALAICYMDTSQWSPSHPAFQLLHAQPGTTPICHFLPAVDLVWLPHPA